jgi:branched-chain amino acid transport system ATP-binding protein
MSNPKVLLLDELSLGLAPVVIEALYNVVDEIAGEGTTLVLVEQDVSRALAAADRVYCLLEGRVSLHASTAEVTRDHVVEAYFGAVEH